MKIKTIDIQAKEWLDKVNGNSYFSAVVTVNFGLKTAKQINLSFQYGYGAHYKDMAFKELETLKIIKDVEHYNNGSSEAIWQYCERNKIILRASKQTNCKKRDLIK